MNHNDHLTGKARWFLRACCTGKDYYAIHSSRFDSATLSDDGSDSIMGTPVQ